MKENSMRRPSNQLNSTSWNKYEQYASTPTFIAWNSTFSFLFVSFFCVYFLIMFCRKKDVSSRSLLHLHQFIEIDLVFGKNTFVKPRTNDALAKIYCYKVELIIKGTKNKNELSHLIYIASFSLGLDETDSVYYSFFLLPKLFQMHHTLQTLSSINPSGQYLIVI